MEYNKSQIQFACLTSKTEDVEICPMTGPYAELDKGTATEALDRDIIEKERELADLKSKRAYFLTNFGKFFEGGGRKDG